MTKLMLMFTIVAGAALLTPQEVEAADCTRQYSQCLNDSYDTSGLLRHLADLECGVRYAACLMDVIMKD